MRFTQKDGELIFTREGAHSRPRILYREDETGKEITGTLLKRVRELPNVKILEYLTMTDMIEEDGCCCGVLARGDSYGDVKISADYTIFASGRDRRKLQPFHQLSASRPGTLCAFAKNTAVRLEHLDYVQIHPDDAVFGETGAPVSDFGIRTGRERCFMTGRDAALSTNFSREMW